MSFRIYLRELENGQTHRQTYTHTEFIKKLFTYIGKLKRIVIVNFLKNQALP